MGEILMTGGAEAELEVTSAQPRWTMYWLERLRSHRTVMTSLERDE